MMLSTPVGIKFGFLTIKKKFMNKLILNFGLLVFCLSVIFFSRVGLPIQDVLFKSFLIFILLTVMLSIIVIIFIRAVNKVAFDKNSELTKNKIRK